MSLITMDWQRGLTLLSGLTADNGAPTGDAGVSLDPLRDSDGNIPRFGTVALRATDDGAASAKFRLWFKFPGLPGHAWCPAGTGTDADKGKLNNGAAIGEVVDSEIRHAELVQVSQHATRVYLEMDESANLGAADAVLLVERYPK